MHNRHKQSGFLPIWLLVVITAAAFAAAGVSSVLYNRKNNEWRITNYGSVQTSLPSPASTLAPSPEGFEIPGQVESGPTSPKGTPGQFCGGIAAIPCPLGYWCQFEGSYPDAGGYCIKLERQIRSS